LTSPHSRPVVYLTLGTVGWGTVDLMRDALAGLTELPVDVLVAIGSYFDPNQLGPLPDSVRVERFVRQDLVLPQVDLAVHHGGSGTLLAAAAEGVPQLVMPLGADQFQNADALAASGAGLALPQGGVTAAAVRDGVRQLMDDPGPSRGREPDTRRDPRPADAGRADRRSDSAAGLTNPFSLTARSGGSWRGQLPGSL